jgi:hypothetical protein
VLTPRPELGQGAVQGQGRENGIDFSVLAVCQDVGQRNGPPSHLQLSGVGWGSFIFSSINGSMAHTIHRRYCFPSSKVLIRRGVQIRRAQDKTERHTRYKRSERGCMRHAVFTEVDIEGEVFWAKTCNFIHILTYIFYFNTIFNFLTFSVLLVSIGILLCTFIHFKVLYTIIQWNLYKAELE